MRSLINFVFLFIVAGGVGLFVGSVHRVVQDVGAIYYWNAVYLGTLSGITLWLYRSKLGYSLEGSATITTPIMIVLGAVGLPNVVPYFMTPDEYMANIPLAWLITLGAFFTLLSCGATGVKISTVGAEDS